MRGTRSDSNVETRELVSLKSLCGIGESYGYQDVLYICRCTGSARHRDDNNVCGAVPFRSILLLLRSSWLKVRLGRSQYTLVVGRHAVLVLICWKSIVLLLRSSWLKVRLGGSQYRVLVGRHAVLVLICWKSIFLLLRRPWLKVRLGRS